MEKLKVSTRLHILLAIAALAFFIQVAIAGFGMKHLGELQDEGSRRSIDSEEMQRASGMGEAMYQVIADTIINRDFAMAEKDWQVQKAIAEAQLAKALDMTDTPEEKQGAEKATLAFKDLVSIYETKLLPLVKEDGKTEEIRLLDGAMDIQIAAIREHLEPLAASFAAEAKVADQQFDSTRTRTIEINLVCTVVMLAAMVAISLLVGASIIRQLGGEPVYAMMLAKQIAAGDLTGRIEVDQKYSQSVIASMKEMQHQLLLRPDDV